ncbi:MAG: serine protease, partial [Xanthobacteraceae bacterium]
MPRFSSPAVLAVAVALAAVSIPGANAQERAVPTSPQQVELSFAPIVKRVAPAVVNVYAQHIVENSNP